MEEITWEEYERVVNTYRALGYRMVCFDNPEVPGGSWVMTFDTHGRDADELPIEAFDIPEVHQWMEWYYFTGPISEVSHLDATDDMDELSNYDIGKLPVFKLADPKYYE